MMWGRIDPINAICAKKGKPVIGVILGQRCGTSSIAKELHGMGFPFLEPIDTRPFPGVHPIGLWESWEARDWNGKIMKNFRCSSLEPALLPFLIWPELQGQFGRWPETFIVKDPQLASTWPIWFRTLQTSRPGAQMVSVWCRRDFDEQVRSLVTRYPMRNETLSVKMEIAKYCVRMYELIATAAAQYIPTLEVWLKDEHRVENAAEWFRSHGVEEETKHGQV